MILRPYVYGVTPICPRERVTSLLATVRYLVRPFLKRFLIIGIHSIRLRPRRAIGKGFPKAPPGPSFKRRAFHKYGFHKNLDPSLALRMTNWMCLVILSTEVIYSEHRSNLFWACRRKESGFKLFLSLMGQLHKQKEESPRPPLQGGENQPPLN